MYLLGRAAVLERTIPFLKKSQHRGGRLEPLQSVVAPQKKRAKMPQFAVAQSPRFIVIFREEKRRIVAVTRILVKQMIYGTQERCG